MAIDHYLSKDMPIYAHRGISNSRKETLIAHSKRTKAYFDHLCAENHLSPYPLINQLTFEGKSLTADEKDLLSKLFSKAIYLHDIGKLNSEFQRVKMHTEIAASGYKNSNHSLLSALLFLDICEEDLVTISDVYRRASLRYIAVLFSYVISRHHTFLTNFDLMNYIQELNDLFAVLMQHQDILRFYTYSKRLRQLLVVQRMEDDISFYAEREEVCICDEKEGSLLYLLMKLLYSCLVTSDFLATYYFFNRKEPYTYYLDSKDKRTLLAQFKQSNVCCSVEKFKRNPDDPSITPINRLRSRLFIETEKQLTRHPDQMIYYLEAPTGSGKTAVSVNLALHLLTKHEDLNKLIYVFPFNTLVEQTKDNLNKWFANIEKDYRIQVVNSVTPIVREHEKAIALNLQAEEQATPQTIDYNEEVLRRQMLQYPITVTSHVNLFNHLFGIGKESHLGLASLAHSVVILDEIQSYRNAIWPEMIQMLHDVSQMYHIVIIIMSATLPKLDHLLCKEENFTPLVINRSDYFLNPIFRDRVHLSFELLQQGTLTLDAVVHEIVRIKKKHGKVRLLVEVIKKVSAHTIYEALRKNFPKEQRIMELTGDDSRYVRQQVLNQINGTEEQKPLDDVILIATQVIEAGVDIDMDIGFKDISILDSEEQFLGRINRSCLKEDCWAYFFDMDSTARIYKQDLRLEKDLNDPHYQQALLDKNYEFFYEQVFERFRQIRNKRDKDYLQFDKMLDDLQFNKIAKYLKLIDEKNYTLVLNFEIKINNVWLSGEKVWNDFKHALKDNEVSYAEKTVKLSQIAELLDYFTFNIFQEPKYFDESIGSLYFVQDCTEFVEKDPEIGAWKFLSEKYVAKSEASFL